MKWIIHFERSENRFLVEIYWVGYKYYLMPALITLSDTPTLVRLVSDALVNYVRMHCRRLSTSVKCVATFWPLRPKPTIQTTSWESYSETVWNLKYGKNSCPDSTYHESQSSTDRQKETQTSVSSFNLYPPWKRTLWDFTVHHKNKCYIKKKIIIMSNLSKLYCIKEWCE